MTDLTEKYYHDTLASIALRAAINLGTFSDYLAPRYNNIPRQEQVRLEAALSGYVMDHLQRGQIRDLEGLDRLIDVIGSFTLEVNPEQKTKLHQFYSSIDSLALLSFLQCYNNGVLTDNIFYLARVPKKDALGETEVEKRMFAAINYVQRLVPDMSVTDEEVLLLKQGGELLLLAHGQHQGLEHMTPELGRALGLVLGKTFDIKLPYFERGLLG